MKRVYVIIASGVVTLLMGSFFMHTTVRADQITDTQLVIIQKSCSNIQASLSRTHANDALLRVKLGQLYESIATNLMAPFNSRVVLNRLDSTSLVAVTNDYQDYFGQFRLNYRAYEEALSQAMKVNCQEEPAAFYDMLTSAREARKRVRESIKKINNEIKDYQRTFEAFSRSYLEENHE